MGAPRFSAAAAAATKLGESPLFISIAAALDDADNRADGGWSENNGGV